MLKQLHLTVITTVQFQLEKAEEKESIRNAQRNSFH